MAAWVRVLNVGCGPIRLEGSIGVDWNADSAADVHHDLNRIPWPFRDHQFQRVVLSHILEHLEEPQKAIREAHRVCAAGGKVEVITPHFSSYESYGDLTHRYHFGLVSFKPYYQPERGRPLFKLISRKLSFGTSPLCWTGRVLSRISFDLYEKYFAFQCPARNMEFILEVIK